MFSTRTRWDLTQNRLALSIDERRSAGLPILDLTESNPTRCGIDYPDQLLSELATPASLLYEPSPKGILKAREAVAQYYEDEGITVDPDCIVLTASTSEAYGFLFRLLADPNDRLIAPIPSYPLFDFLATLSDVTLDAYPLRYDSRWYVDLEELDARIQWRTRALLVVNPNNPTGSFLSGPERSAIIEICRARGMALICDEVFAEYGYESDSGRVPSMAGTKEALTFALGGISKLLGLPQMKLGWIVVSGPTAAKRQALARLEVIADTYLSVNTPVQRALPAWLSMRERLTGQIRSRVIANRSWLVSRLEAVETLSCLAAQAGWYAVLRGAHGFDEEPLILDLLNREGVLVNPGYFFDLEPEGHLVVSLLPPPDEFREAIERILRSVG